MSIRETHAFFAHVIYFSRSHTQDGGIVIMEVKEKRLVEVHATNEIV